MKTYSYKVVKSTYPCDSNQQEEFGIAAVEVYDGCAAVLTAVYHLSTDLDAVTAFADLCNRLELSPLHLSEAAEDFLAQL